MTEDEGSAPLRQALACVNEAILAVMAVRPMLAAGPASTETAFAVGEALGTLARARSMIGRDIDENNRRISPSRVSR